MALINSDLFNIEEVLWKVILMQTRESGQD